MTVVGEGNAVEAAEESASVYGLAEIPFCWTFFLLSVIVSPAKVNCDESGIISDTTGVAVTEMGDRGSSLENQSKRI